MRMWFNGGVGLLMAVCSVLVTATHPRLGLHMQKDARPVKAAVLECLGRYVRSAHELGVVLVHRNHPDVTQYVTSVRAPLTILNAGHLRMRPGRDMVFPTKATRTIIPMPRSLMVFLVAKKDDVRFYYSLLRYDIYTDAQPRYLALCLEPALGPTALEFFYKARLLALYNLVVLNAKDTRVYSRFPRNGTLCHSLWPRKQLGQCQHLSLDQLYAHTEPLRYTSCIARVLMPYGPPFALDNASHSEQPLVAGYEVALLNLVIGRLKVSPFIDTYHYGGACVSATTYYTDAVRWYVPVAGPRAQWKSVVQVFQAPLWFTILAFFLFNTLAWWLMGAGGYAECVLGSLVTLLNGSLPLPRRTHRRFLVVSWTLCALVLGAAYQSQLLSTLLTPVAGSQPITNEQELLASDMPVDISAVKLEMDKMRSGKQIVAHAKKFQVDPDKPRAVLQYSMTAKYWAREQSDARGQPKLYAFEEVAGYVPMCVKLGLFTVAMPPVNRMVQRLMEVGIVAKFMREVDFSGYVTAGGSEDEPLTVRHLDFAFLVLLMGCALAIVAFLLEVVVWRTQHGWWSALCTTIRSCGTRVRGCWRTCTTSVRRWRRRARFLRRRRAFRRRMLAQVN